jgi:hypothetical protein
MVWSGVLIAVQMKLEKHLLKLTHLNNIVRSLNYGYHE